MNRYIYLSTLIMLTSCSIASNVTNKRHVSNSTFFSTTVENSSTEHVKLTDKTVKFLWRVDKYNELLKDTFNSIFIDEDYCKTITDIERAALGYVATFIGNECGWDGPYNNDRSNLKCKILTALNLGYQCSDKHLGFLRDKFKNDAEVLKELESYNCPTTPDGATIQTTFDEIIITIKGDKISVFFKASGFNIRESEHWSWTETDYFQFSNDNIELIKKDKSKPNFEKLDIGE